MRLLWAPKLTCCGGTDALSAQFRIGIAHIVGGADGLVFIGITKSRWRLP